MQRIAVHGNTLDAAHAQESIDLLEYIGYYVSITANTSGFDLVIDKRSPNWHGWRDVISSLEWKHRDKIVEYNSLTDLDRMPVCVLNYEEDEETCFT